MRTIAMLVVGWAALANAACKSKENYEKFMQESKVSEAKSNLGKIAVLVEEYYDKSSMQVSDPTVIRGDFAAPVARFPQAPPCIKDPNSEFRRNGQQVPREPDAIAGRKYQPAESDWMQAEGGDHAAWAAMHWAVTQPMQFGYCYQGSGEGMESRFTVWAFGDLDGDGVWATYQRVGTVDPTGRPLIGPVAVINEGE